MTDASFPPDKSKHGKPDSRPTGACRTEQLVRETWRQYHVARLAEAQFGPESLEASIAQSRALESYRVLRGSLREIDPFYRPETRPRSAMNPGARHLQLVRDDPDRPEAHGEP